MGTRTENERNDANGKGKSKYMSTDGVRITLEVDRVLTVEHVKEIAYNFKLALLDVSRQLARDAAREMARGINRERPKMEFVGIGERPHRDGSVEYWPVMYDTGEGKLIDCDTSWLVDQDQDMIRRIQYGGSNGDS